MLSKYGNQCLCFVISLQEVDEYMKRTKVRTEKLTLNPKTNKYLSFSINISLIQEHILNATDSYNDALKSDSQQEDQKNYIEIIENDNIGNSMLKIDQTFQ